MSLRFRTNRLWTRNNSHRPWPALVISPCAASAANRMPKSASWCPARGCTYATNASKPSNKCSTRSWLRKPLRARRRSWPLSSLQRSRPSWTSIASGRTPPKRRCPSPYTITTNASCTRPPPSPRMPHMPAWRLRRPTLCSSAPPAPARPCSPAPSPACSMCRLPSPTPPP